MENPGRYTEYSFEETYPDGSKHVCGWVSQNIKDVRHMMEMERKWLKQQLLRSDLSEETLKLRQSQLETIKLVSRTKIISEWE